MIAREIKKIKRDGIILYYLVFTVLVLGVYLRFKAVLAILGIKHQEVI